MNYKTITFALCLGMAGTLAAQSIYPLETCGKDESGNECSGGDKGLIERHPSVAKSLSR